MAIFRPGVRQGALGAMRQGQLGQFLGQHPQAGAAYNRAFQQGGGRANQIAAMNANTGMNRQQARLSLGQASGGRPRPIAGRPPGAGAGMQGGAGAPAPPTAGPSPAPPTTQPMPPGAAPSGGSMGTLGSNLAQMGQTSGGYGFNPYGGGGQYGQMNAPQIDPGIMQQLAQMRQANPGNYSGGGLGGMMGNFGMGGMSGGNMYGRMNPNIPPGLQGNQALQGLMGSVNPGMQSVLGSRLGQMGQNAGGYGYQPPRPQNGALGFGQSGQMGGGNMGMAGQLGVGNPYTGIGQAM